MEKQYLSAPLPFVGQKRMFAKEYMKVLGMVKDAKVFVDLFGGSGLLSHITKRQRHICFLGLIRISTAKIRIFIAR